MDQIPLSRFDIVSGVLAMDDYYMRLKNNRLILLPYVAEKYCYTESGPFIEAACRGIPADVPEFTTMARYIQSGTAAGVVYQDNDDASIARAVNDALVNIAELSRTAISLAEAWRTKHDANSVLESLLDSFS